MTEKKLKIGYTLGDLGGVGPEIFDKFKTAHSTDERFEIVLVDQAETVALNAREIKVGEPSAIAGEHSFQTLKKAVAMAKAGEIDCLITGPVAKESLAMAGHFFSGQTEILANLNNLNKEEIEMFFIVDDLKVVLGTRHIPLLQVSKEIEGRLESVFKNSVLALKNIFHIDNPNIAVAGVNPHAGENGLLGTEENDFMKAMIADCNKQGNCKIEGPFPADTMFAQAAHKYLKHEKQKYDLYVAAYHDQALPMVKGICGFKAINLTVGLPFVRASVDHGTAFDIAGKNLASFDSLNACTEFCLEHVGSYKKEHALL